ncbi:23 kDa integral membrane protein [Drosophila grimshawi]|uniref:Tetraspanin n=1 Tax=Drosophila grimshawi TaxID=7222 RepID=B4J3X2_DROGR|nr:23 kDa integral membrane protein [Drosophila grimshawi]EDW01555.1 GH21503 [Drosophila grimshawi]
MGLSETTVKHLLLLLNFVYTVLGLLLIGFGIFFLAYVTSVSIGENVVGGLIIGLGVVIIILSVFGCLAAIHESPKRLLIYVIAVVLLILTQLMFLSMVSHGTQDGISGSINEGFEKLWDAERNETGALEYYESWLHCCGVNGSEDYAVIDHAVPKSCCVELKCVDRSNIYKVGCKSQFVEYLDDRLLVFKIVCWLLILGEAIGAFLGWLLLTGLKNQGRRNNAVWM